MKGKDESEESTESENEESKGKSQDLDTKEMRKSLDKELKVHIEPVSLTLDMIRGGLSGLTQNLINMKYTYSKLSVQKNKIKNIEILSGFVHLRFLDLSGNRISCLKPLGSLEFLEVLNVSDNRLQCASKIPMLKHLKHLNLSDNRLESLTGFLPNFITHLEIGGNKLETLEGMTSYIFPNIVHLDLQRNKLDSLKHLQLPRLEKLFVSENHLVNLSGLHRCPMLKVLDLERNQISRLKDFPSLVNLEFVNLKQNQIRQFTETFYFMHCPNIKELLLADNPITKSSQYRANIVEVNPNLQRLDSMSISELELEEGKKNFQNRLRGLIPPICDDPLVLSPPQTPVPLNTELMQEFSSKSGVTTRQNTAASDLCPPNTPYESRPATNCMFNHAGDMLRNYDKKKNSNHLLRKSTQIL